MSKTQKAFLAAVILLGIIVMAFFGSSYLSARRELTALKKELKTALPKYMLPDLILKREQLPRTTSGKIDRRELRQEAEREHLIH